MKTFKDIVKEIINADTESQIYEIWDSILEGQEITPEEYKIIRQLIGKILNAWTYQGIQQEPKI